jgi:REP element-mobilizing transposase RayT
MDSTGKRKEYRPLSEKKWIHLTLKSEKAKGSWSFLTPKNRQIIRKILTEKSKKWGVQITEVVNVGNHLHIKLKFKYREGFQNFLRSTTAQIARKITNAKKGNKLKAPSENQNKFWQGLAFTRVLKTSFEELQLKGYFKANRKQAKQGEKAREEFLNKFNEWIYKMRYGDPSPASQ